MKKNSGRGSAGSTLLKPLFPHSRKRFSKFLHKFSLKFYLISLAYNISFYLTANHNAELQCVICTCVTNTFCTGVTLELHCSQPIRIE